MRFVASSEPDEVLALPLIGSHSMDPQKIDEILRTDFVSFSTINLPVNFL